MQHPYSINIYLADGKPDGLRLITKTGWSGLGVVFSRNDLPDIKTRAEFQRPGVYVLVGINDEDNPLIYIGEGDPIKPRLESHYANKDFWTWSVFFCSNSNELNKAHIQYLESELIRKAKEAKRVQLDNTQSPSKPNLSEMEKAIGESFLREIADIYPILGLTAFDKPEKKEKDKEIFYLKGPHAEGKGYESSKGFVVLKGAKARKEIAPASIGMLQKKFDHFLNEGLFKEEGSSYILTQDYVFSSPSLAAAQLLARNANGRIEWKTKEAKTLKDVQEEKIEKNKD